MGKFVYESNVVAPPIEEILSLPIVLSHQMIYAVAESLSYEFECYDVEKKVHCLSPLLRSAVVRFASSSTVPLHQHPVRGIFNHVTYILEHALMLVRRCSTDNIVIPEHVFQLVFNRLDASVGYMTWLLSILDESDGGKPITFSLPPNASFQPMSVCLWLLKKGGISPFLLLFKKDRSTIPLSTLVNDQKSARLISDEHGIPLILHVLRNSPVIVQIEVAKLIAGMAKHDHLSREGFAQENATEELVTLLASDDDDDDDGVCNFKNHSIASVKDANNTPLPKLILELKTKCSEALWMLARDSVANSRKLIQAAGGVLGLAKLIEGEKGCVKVNCLMMVMEIASNAQGNPELRKDAFENNSPGAKAIVKQLVRLINESDDHVIKTAAIRAIGHLAQTFRAKETSQVIGLLVKQVSHKNPDVATESVIALRKFTCLQWIHYHALALLSYVRCRFVLETLIDH